MVEDSLCLKNMSDINLSAGKTAVNSLKEAQNIGKELGGVITNQQADMEKTIQEQSRKRMEAKAKEAYLKQMAEFKAFEKYEKNKAHESEINKLKNQVTNKYGKGAWAEVEVLKAKLEKERLEEESNVNSDRQKQTDVFFWCLGVAALITYFFKLYKL
jgi:hypothetical protein